MQDLRTTESIELMKQFAERTGLTAGRPRRYLWTDAFAVCNLLGLRRLTGEEHYEELALRLVDQVHHELGRHRSDDRRTGWLSGRPSDEAEVHPTIAGLRIGKALPERAVNEPLQSDLEWDRDGQYFHYLTKWMHALDQMSRYTHRPVFNTWARELATTAHRAFTRGRPGEERMIWKASIDLSRALVGSMGQHDPLDGVVTSLQLDATAEALGVTPSLGTATAAFTRMLEREHLATGDALGIGGLLFDAYRLAQLHTSRALTGAILAAALTGLRHYVEDPELRAPAQRRLAFRELGLAIGLAAVSKLEADGLAATLDARGQSSLIELAEFLPLRDEIELFWRQPHHRATSTWLGHIDINEVMLATSLAPDGFLALGALERASDRHDASDDEARFVRHTPS